MVHRKMPEGQMNAFALCDSVYFEVDKATRWILTKSPSYDGINVLSLNIANQGSCLRSILLR